MELTDNFRYIVTELMWTNLQQLLSKGPIHDDFSKYFTYQILVSDNVPLITSAQANIINAARIEICSFSWYHSSGPQTQQPPY